MRAQLARAENFAQRLGWHLTPADIEALAWEFAAIRSEQLAPVVYCSNPEESDGSSVCTVCGAITEEAHGPRECFIECSKSLDGALTELTVFKQRWLRLKDYIQSRCPECGGDGFIMGDGELHLCLCVGIDGGS